MLVDTAKPQVPASSSSPRPQFYRGPPLRDNGDGSQHHSSAQYFHGISAHANVGNAFPFPCRPDMHLAWATALDALSNHYPLIATCDAVLDHPTRSAACCRSCGWVFATVEEHPSLSFESAFAPFGTEKVEKICTGFLQKIRCLNVSE